MSFAPIDYYDGVLNKGTIRPVYEREDKALDAIRAHVSGRDSFRLLDVGCGDGTFLKAVRDRVGVPGDLHGVDYSAHELGKAAGLPFTFRRCNVEEGIPYEDAGFDVVYSGEVIEHLYNPDFMLEECHRVLRPGGLVVLSTPNLQAWYNRVMFVLGIQPLFYEISTKSTALGAGPLVRLKKQRTPVGHLRIFNKRGIVDLLENEGFEVLNVSGAVFPSLPTAIRRVDRAFNRLPSLASNLVVAARKRPEDQVRR